MVKMYFLCCSYRTRIKDHGIIKLRIAGLDKQINHSTRICIPIADWDSKKVQVKARHEQAYILNKQISDLRAKVIDFIESKTKKEEIISADLLKEHLLGKSTSTQSILEMIQYYIENSRNRLSDGTIKQYESIKRKIARYLKEELLIPDYPLDKLNYRFLNDYKVYLESKCANSPNTVDRDIKRLKAVVHFALKLEILKEDPFIKYKSFTVPTHRSSLNMDEITKIEELESSNNTVTLIKDAFLFMCYTGLSYSDLRKLTSNDIHTSIGGKRVIKINRHKTDEFCMVPLMNKAEVIIDKYKEYPTVLLTGNIIPTLSNQKMNQYLKLIMELASINKTITCHVARHSFATNSLEHSIPIETVSKMLGHSNIKTTQIYAKITETKLLNDFALFETEIKPKKQSLNVILN
jgi:integrase/recombinase XerD